MKEKKELLQVAACTRKTFDRACQKCGERSHKVRECRRVRVKSESVAAEEKLTRSCHKLRCRTESGSQIKEEGRKGQRAAKRVSKDEAAARRLGTATMAKMTAGMSLATPASSPEPDMASWQVDDPTADTANPNVICAGPTRPEDESSNPPEALPSTSLKGGSWTGVSDKLGKDPVDESTTMQPTWMPRDAKSSGEVHEVARSHEEAAGDEVTGGEAGKRTRTSDNEEHQACECIDDRETKTAGQQVDDKATDTPNPHAKCTGLTRPVGTSHDPANELSGEREGGRVAKSEPEAISAPIEGWSGQMPTDHYRDRYVSRSVSRLSPTAEPFLSYPPPLFRVSYYMLPIPDYAGLFWTIPVSTSNYSFCLNIHLLLSCALFLSDIAVFIRPYSGLHHLSLSFH